jgi:hypothetical protein
VQMVVELVKKSLAIIKELDLDNRAHQSVAMSILKRSMQICLNLGGNEIMKAKSLELVP